MSWQQIAVYAAPIGIALVTGKFIRRLILLPFEYLVKKNQSPVEQVLLNEAEHDLGLDGETLVEASNAPVDKK